MSEGWAIAIFSCMTGAMLVMAKCLWDIKSAFRHFVSQPECSQKMCGHEKEIELLRKSTAKNQKALSEIKPIVKLQHGIDIDVD